MADDFALLGLGVDSGPAIRGIRAFTNETSGMLSAVKQASVALASLFASAKVTQFITRTSAEFANFGDQMAKMSQRLDISAQKLTEMSYVASQSGTSIENYERGIRLLQRNLENADEEAKVAVAAFGKLGISLSEIKQQNPDEQFKTVASAIAALPTPTERTAMAMRVFGRSGAELIPFFQQGRDGMERLAQKARSLGIVMSKEDYESAVQLKDGMDTLTKSIGAVRNAIISGLTPELVAATESLAQTAGEIVAFVREHELLVKTVLKLGAAVAGITAVYGAYKILQTAMMAQRALRASLAAQTAQNIAQTTAETAALTANTAAQMANNAAKGAGVATGGAKAAAGMLGGTGAAAFAFTALAAGAVSLFVDGFKSASKEGAGIFSKSIKGAFNVGTLGLATIREKWKDAGQGADVGLERTKLLANTFTLGISGATEKLAEMLGVTTTIRDVLLSLNDEYQQEVQRGEQYDAELGKSNDWYKNQEIIKGYMENGREDFRDSDEWSRFVEDQENQRKRLTLGGTDAAQFDSKLAETRMKEANTNARLWERDYAKADEAAQQAFDAMQAAEENYWKVSAETAGDLSKEADAKRASAKGAVSNAQREYEEAQKKVDALADNTYKEVMEAQLKAQEDFLNASENYASAFNAEEIRKRDERIAQEDSALQSRYTGLQSDESIASKARQESELLSARLQEMEEAAKRIEEIQNELQGKTDLTEIASLRQQLELNKEIAGSLQDRLSISDEINQKNTEQEQALDRIAKKEEELTRIRGERDKQLAEQAQKLGEDYALKNMNDREKLLYRMGELGASQAESEQFAHREQYIQDMDAQIKSLGEIAAQGGTEGLSAEKEMNRLVEERARLEDELAKDKSKNLDRQFAALNAIDDIAGAKAEEYTNKYKEQIDKLSEAEKNDRKPVSVQSAVDAASAEGFAQMNRIYDTSQKKIEDHTKNIKEYTRQMKAYLMQLAAQGQSDWALDVA